jgi:hypothetical protein
MVRNISQRNEEFGIGVALQLSVFPECFLVFIERHDEGR